MWLHRERLRLLDLSLGGTGGGRATTDQTFITITAIIIMCLGLERLTEGKYQMAAEEGNAEKKKMTQGRQGRTRELTHMDVIGSASASSLIELPPFDYVVVGALFKTRQNTATTDQTFITITAIIIMCLGLERLTEGKYFFNVVAH
ncbi:hypothetical protein CRUP_038765 [Coryphaenoides rupestris]|nr:hypothetical protein CRUP_038765 [Coryphaenoides rupestris]